MRQQKILIFTSHVFLPGYRKASIHFIAQRWARQGHDVRVATVGYSWLSTLKDGAKFKELKARQYNRFETIEPNLRVGARVSLIHPFSSRRKALNLLNRPAFRLYGGTLPTALHSALLEADVVVIDSGTALSLFDYVKRHNPEARTLYFCRDLLKSVGAAPILQEIEQQAIARFDAVCVPSRRLADQLPAGGHVHVIPQGVDGALFDAAHASPYPAGSANAVSVGDMLFDEPAVAAAAMAAPEVTFHIFGAAWHGDLPPNVLLYGECDFAAIVPYIVHADIGIAPYRLTEAEVYLAESSLKLAQYSYCGLPILLPDAVPFDRPHAIGYRQDGEEHWREKIDAALAMGRSDTARQGILSWDEVAGLTLAVVVDTQPFGHAPATPAKAAARLSPVDLASARRAAGEGEALRSVESKGPMKAAS